MRRGPTCEPCGECRACIDEGHRLRELRDVRRRLRRADTLLRAAAFAIADEVNADLESDHPILRAHARVLARINRFRAALDSGAGGPHA